jgi:hypothetical protein
VAPGGVSAGSMLSTMGGIGVNVGASTLNMGGLGVLGGMSIPNMVGLGRRPDPHEGVSAPHRSHHGSLFPLLDPGHLPFYHPPTLGVSSGSGIPPPLAAFGGFTGVPLSGLPPPPLVRQPDPDEEVFASPCSHCGSLLPSLVAVSASILAHRGALIPSLVFLLGCLGEHSGVQSLVDGYQGGRSLSLTSGGHEGPQGQSSSSSSGPAYSSTLALRHRGSDSSVGDKSNWAASSLDDILLSPIPLPVDHFTLPPIKSGQDYLKSRDLILFWLHSPGFSTAHADLQLVIDGHNALASQFWEGQIRTSLKDGSVWYLFENTDSKYFGKGFEMIQVLEDNFCPFSISNSFTTLLSLFNNTQGNKEGIHEFWSWFEGQLGALSRLSIVIPSILQVMLFLCAMHSCYADLLSQFASKHKDLSLATINSVMADACFMDKFVVVGGKQKPSALNPSS